VDYDATGIPASYVEGRRLPRETVDLWLGAIERRVPREGISTVVDVGCGTGRFSAALSARFAARLIGVDPSREMLDQARAAVREPGIEFVEGEAEHLPSGDGTVDLLFLSMTYHHITDMDAAGDEFRRVLRSGGYLCIRNATVDRLDSFEYLRYFPSARALDAEMLPSSSGLIEAMRDHGFEFISHDLIRQRFADTRREYYEKVRHRALSDLARIPDAEFDAGVKDMAEALERDDVEGPVHEPVDLFVFRRP